MCLDGKWEEIYICKIQNSLSLIPEDLDLRDSSILFLLTLQ